jgi:hypothetical protein
MTIASEQLDPGEAVLIVTRVGSQSKKEQQATTRNELTRSFRSGSTKKKEKRRPRVRSSRCELFWPITVNGYLINLLVPAGSNISLSCAILTVA